MQSTHEKYEFVIEATKEAFKGSSQEEVFNRLPESFLPPAATPRLRARLCLASHGIDAEPPEFGPSFYDDFFKMLQPPLVGTWKWYDSLIGEYWRFAPDKNDLVRRCNNGMGRKNFSSETLDKFRNMNMKYANSILLANPEKKRNACIKGGLIGGRSCAEKRKLLSEEDKKAIVENIMEGQRRWRASLTDEEKARRSEKIRASNAKRKGRKHTHSEAWLARKRQRDEEKAALDAEQKKKYGVVHTAKWFRKQIEKIDDKLNDLQKSPEKYRHSQEWFESKRMSLEKKRDDLERQLQSLTA